MKDFKKGGRFGGSSHGGGFKRGGFDRGAPRDGGGFGGGSRRDFGNAGEMHQAVCADCGKTCEVPFRPNGKKPVFCKDCFANNRDEESPREFSHSSRPPHRREERAPMRHEGGDRGGERGGELKSQIEMLSSKIDKLTRIVEALQPRESTKVTAPKEVTSTPVKKAVKKVSKAPKKVSKK